MSVTGSIQCVPAAMFMLLSRRSGAGVAFPHVATAGAAMITFIDTVVLAAILFWSGDCPAQLIATVRRMAARRRR
jgi:hypothetical protein